METVLKEIAKESGNFRLQLGRPSGQADQNSTDVARLIHDNDSLVVSFARDDDENNAAESAYPRIH